MTSISIQKSNNGYSVHCHGNPMREFASYELAEAFAAKVYRMTDKEVVAMRYRFHEQR